MAGDGVSDGPGHSPTGGDRRYINRELSWLDFNRRVLELAEADEQPLLERAKFLAIFSTNLDEFFQVRVAGLKDQLAAGVAGTAPDGLPVAEQLRAIRAEVESQLANRSRIYNDELAPQLAEQGTRLVQWTSLTPSDIAYVESVFEAQMFPVLTPLGVDPGHPFPYISNLSLNLAVMVRDPQRGERRFAAGQDPTAVAWLFGSTRRRTVCPRRAGHLCFSRRALPRDGDRELSRLPGDPQRRLDPGRRRS